MSSDNIQVDKKKSLEDFVANELGHLARICIESDKLFDYKKGIQIWEDALFTLRSGFGKVEDENEKFNPEDFGVPLDSFESIVKPMMIRFKTKFEAKDLFDRLDREKKAYLNCDEMMLSFQFFNSIRIMMQGHISATSIFQLMDTSGEGTIDVEEFTNYTHRTEPMILK